MYELSLPGDVRRILNFFKVSISFGLSDTNAVLTCMGLDGYYARLIFWFCVPPVLIVVVLLGSLFETLAFGEEFAFGRRPTATLLFESATPLILRGLFLVYPFIVNVAFEAFSCHDFEGNPLIVDVSLRHEPRRRGLVSPG